MPLARDMHRPFRLAVLATLTLLLPGSALAGADAKPADVTTALPPVTLSQEQLHAIAAKARPALSPPAVHMTASKNPGFEAPPAPALPADVGLSRTAAKLEQLERTRLLPMISPSLGVIPRPEWSDPSLHKEGDIVVIGGRRLLLPHAPAGAPRSGVAR